jgi:hypothetical protein
MGCSAIKEADEVCNAEIGAHTVCVHTVRSNYLFSSGNSVVIHWF